LPLEEIRSCIGRAAAVLAPEGALFATFFENACGKRGPITHQPGGMLSYPDRDPFHYSFVSLERLARDCRMGCEYVGEWGHPRGQKLIIFRHA